MKTFGLALGIALILAALALRLWWDFRYPLEKKARPAITMVTVISLALLFGGGLTIWLASR